MTAERTFDDPLARLADLPVPVLEVLCNLASDAQVISEDERFRTTARLYETALRSVAEGDRPSESLLANVGSLLAATQHPKAWAEIVRPAGKEESA